MPPLPEPTARKNPSLADRIAAIVIERYLALPSSQRPQLRSNGVQEWTPLAGIVLVSPSGNETELVSLGAGSKVLPTGQRSASGDLVNDLHAEVIAIRGARRWLLEEVRRLLAVGNKTGRWLTQGRAGGKWRLLDGVSLHIYVSCLPCESLGRMVTSDCLVYHPDSLDSLRLISLQAEMRPWFTSPKCRR